MSSVTVNICSYKYGHLAAQAIDSVLTQTRKPDVIRLYDDGVGDCNHLKEIYPEVEVIVRPYNLGTVANFQDALERTETDYVLFLGADNWLRLDALEILLEDPADINSYDIRVVGEHRIPFAKRVGAVPDPEGSCLWSFDVNTDMNTTNNCHGSSLYNVKKAKEIGYHPSGGSRTEEDWFLFKGMINNGATRKHIPLPLLYYRRHDRNFNSPL